MFSQKYAPKTYALNQNSKNCIEDINRETTHTIACSSTENKFKSSFSINVSYYKQQLYCLTALGFLETVFF
jgi:hypothetical protein